VARPLVVVCSGTAWDDVVSPPRLLATALAVHADILWVDPPLSALTRAAHRHGASRMPTPRLRRLDSAITRLTPAALPLHTRPGVRGTTAWLVRRQVRWAVRRLGGRSPYAVIGGFTDTYRAWPPQVQRVMYGSDDFVAGARLMGLDAGWLARSERRVIARTDLVIAVSEPLAQRWRQMGARVITVPNGVQTATYLAPTEPATLPATLPVTLPPPVVGVVGHLTGRIDLALLEALADDGLSLLLVGPIDKQWEPRRVAALLARPGVLAVGRQPFEAVPAYLKRIDVGVTPYRDTPFNRASFPLKTLEYLAAGLPAVSTDLPAVRWLDTDLVTVADQPAEFVAAVRKAAGQAHDPEQVVARRRFAEQHSWASRAATVARALGLPVSQGVT
jgi:teichuronic acid biosynthesis glycosyltransferase TuaH